MFNIDFFSPIKNFKIEDIISTLLKNTDHRGPWIAGGMGRQLALGEKDFNDIDVWFNNVRQFELTRKTLTETFTNNVHLTHKSDNAETYHVGNHKVQLITKTFFKDIDHLFNHFDFTCCQIAVNKDMSICGPGIEDARSYLLKVNKLNHENFLARYAKYIGYGYRMNTEDVLDILENCKELIYEFDASAFDY